MKQLTLRSILKNDPYYRKWFARTPRLPKVTHGDPWRVLIQKKEDGPWAYRDYRDYADAYEVLRTLLPKTYDAALNCKRTGYPPMKLKVDGVVHHLPMPTYHQWCPYCRRPTIFRKFKQHPLHKKVKFYEAEEMCTVCGVRRAFIHETFKTDWQSDLAWPIQ